MHQTFPDSFIFQGSKESVRKQIGMAVPVNGVQIIFEAILKCYAGEEYENTTPSFQPLIYTDHIDIYNSRVDGQLYLCDRTLTTISHQGLDTKQASHVKIFT